MNQKPAQKIEEHVNHSHSTLNRLLEEIEVHALALCTEVEDRNSLMTDLNQYTHLFIDEITTHITEEEQDLFGWISRRLPTQVDQLFVEHREIEVLLEGLTALVKAGLDHSVISEILIRDINDQVRLLKFAYYAHSNHERLLLERVTLMER
ncbi:MAG: hemerythrin domain-containing protein [Bradymonadaceae bacterium]